MLDGSLRRLARDLPEEILSALLTATGSEQLESSGATWRVLSDGRSRIERRVGTQH
jgi:hypothetical protein